MSAPRLLAILLFASLWGLAPCALAEAPQRPAEEITEPQPIAVGARFFTKLSSPRGYQIYYTYCGFEAGYLKVKYEKYLHFDELEEKEIFTLPLNSSKQTVLSTSPLYGETPATATKLLIAVVDDFGQITVKKFK